MKQRIEELATAAYAEWVNVTCVGDCSEKYAEIIGKAITTAVNEALEMAAREIGPKIERPCSCDICDCGNSGDLRAVAYWDECNANAEAIRKLKV